MLCYGFVFIFYFYFSIFILSCKLRRVSFTVKIRLLFIYFFYLCIFGIMSRSTSIKRKMKKNSQITDKIRKNLKKKQVKSSDLSRFCSLIIKLPLSSQFCSFKQYSCIRPLSLPYAQYTASQ